jgi:hypothetical protein
MTGVNAGKHSDALSGVHLRPRCHRRWRIGLALMAPGKDQGDHGDRQSNEGDSR